MTLEYKQINYQEFLGTIEPSSVGFCELAGNPVWTIRKQADYYQLWLEQLHNNLLIDDAWVICWVNREDIAWINLLASKFGFDTQEPGIRIRMHPTEPIKLHSSTMHPVINYFLLLRKGKPKVNSISFINALSDPGRAPNQERSIELCKQYITVLMQADGNFIAPNCGSGNCLIAAAQLGYNAYGADILERNYMRYLERVRYLREVEHVIL